LRARVVCFSPLMWGLKVGPIPTCGRVNVTSGKRAMVSPPTMCVNSEVQGWIQRNCGGTPSYERLTNFQAIMKQTLLKQTRRTMVPSREPSVQKIAAKVANAVILNRAEHKIFTFNQAFTTWGAAGTVIPITQGLTQGDNIDNRSGDKITLTHCSISLIAAVNPLAVSSTVRLLYFLDTMANGSVPTVADVLQSVSTVGRYQSINLLKHRFRMLWDVTIPLVATASNHVVHKERDFRIKSPVYYQDGANIAGANSKNGMFCIALSDAAVNLPGTAFAVQLQYTDN